MNTTPLTLHLEQAPEIYLVDERYHIVDRIGGQVVVHRIYPASVLDRLADRAAGIGQIADMIARMAGRGDKPPRRRKPKR